MMQEQFNIYEEKILNNLNFCLMLHTKKNLKCNIKINVKNKGIIFLDEIIRNNLYHELGADKDFLDYKKY
jgi:hypothetical protein